MWSAWRKARDAEAQLLLGQTFWALRDMASGWHRGRCAGWLDGLSQASRALDDNPSQRLDTQVWLSGAISPALWLVPPTDLKGGAEWRAWVKVAAVSLHPLQSELAEPIIWVESAKARPALATAIPRACLEEMKSILAPHTVRGVRPLWSSAFSGPAVGSSDGAELWSAFDGESVSCFRIGGDAIGGALTLPGIGEIAQARALHSRRSVGVPISASRLLHLDLSASAAWPSSLQDAWSEAGP